MRTALITGVSGQDGRLLAQLLLDEGLRVVGTTRDVARARAAEGMPANERFELVACALDTPEAIRGLFLNYAPDDVYNLASQSSPRLSWTQPLENAEGTALTAHRLFEAARRHHPRCRIYQASSSEMFGSAPDAPCDELAPLRPTNPYGVAKTYAHHMATTYRAAFGMHIACGILFNHESELRGDDYLTQRIAYGAACAALGVRDSPARDADGRAVVEDGRLVLGNLDAQRDWGAAADAVRAMRMILAHPQPDDFVVGTGRLRSVGDLCAIAYGFLGLDWRAHVRSDARLVRPIDARGTVADAGKARARLGWEPRIAIESVLIEMTRRQLARIRAGASAGTRA